MSYSLICFLKRKVRPWKIQNNLKEYSYFVKKINFTITLSGSMVFRDDNLEFSRRKTNSLSNF